MCLSCHPVHYAERGRCPDCHRGNPAAGRKNIAHVGLISGKYVFFNRGDNPNFIKGKRLINQYACRRCHVIDGRGNRLAVSLDAAAVTKTPEEMVNSIRSPVLTMPYFGVNESRAAFLVNAILAGSQGSKKKESAPTSVHFNNINIENLDVFSIKCGHCHRLVSERLGTLGSGNIGPNLSGLLSSYYPKNFRNNEAWTPQNLAFWIKNPRGIMTWAGMMPIKLSEDQAKELESILLVTLEQKR